MRALATQEASLAGLHARASFLLAAAGIATGTVLGRSGGTLNSFGTLAVGAFGLTAACATWILLPRRRAWKLNVDAATILDTALRHRLNEVEVLNWLARTNSKNWGKNDDRLEELFSILTAGCVALVYRDRRLDRQPCVLDSRGMTEDEDPPQPPLPDPTLDSTAGDLGPEIVESLPDPSLPLTRSDEGLDTKSG